jgi:ABC-type antimicrobial peptide transport system permease subunit
MAIGATAGDVIRLIVAQYVRIGLVGVAAGTTAAFLAMRLVRTYLTGVTTRDPLTYGGVASLLLAVVVLAGWIPARRLRRARLAALLASGT